MEANNLTIGFLGREQYRHTTSEQYRTIETYIELTCRRTTTVTAFTGLASTFEQNMARRVLRMQGRLPNLRLVRYIREQRRHGKRVLDFNLFDYACYDELLRRIAPQEPKCG